MRKSRYRIALRADNRNRRGRGQVLVLADILGFSENPPSFAKRYANIAEAVKNAFSEYVADVRNGRFPNK